MEDQADLLAHHYLSALRLAQAVGQGKDSELRQRAVRYLGLAGSGRLASTSSRPSATWLEPSTRRQPTPQRPRLLERWARALQQQGRLREAQDALQQALTQQREQGDQLATGRSLTTLSLVLALLGDPRQTETLTEALQLLEAEPPGPELVDAYTQQARAHSFAGSYAEVIGAADQARALADRLGLPQPAEALGRRGQARASLGEPEGVEEMRQALSLAIEQGKGREAGVLYNNLAFVAGLYQGPQASLTVTAEGIEFARQRGISQVAEFMVAGRASLLAETGQIEQVLTDAARLADQLEQAGDVGFVDPRSLQLRLLAEQGRQQQAPDPQPMLKAARDSGQPQLLAEAVAAAAPVLNAQAHPERARTLLAELDPMRASRSDPVYAAVLPGLVRSALALADLGLAASLTDGVQPLTPLHQHALTAAKPNSPKPTATTPKPPASTPRPPSTGSSSATSPKPPTPTSATEDASTPSATPKPKPRSARPASCSAHSATNPPSPKPKPCSSKPRQPRPRSRSFCYSL